MPMPMPSSPLPSPHLPAMIQVTIHTAARSSRNIRPQTRAAARSYCSRFLNLARLARALEIGIFSSFLGGTAYDARCCANDGLLKSKALAVAINADIWYRMAYVILYIYVGVHVGVLCLYMMCITLPNELESSSTYTVTHLLRI